MKDLDLSRRNMIVLAGMGVAAGAVSACTPKADAGNESNETETTFDNNGDDPNGVQARERVPFNPKFMSLVHLTSTQGWEISSNDAHFAFEQAEYNAAERTARACEIFANKISKGWKRFREAPEGSEFAVYNRAAPGEKPDYADEVEFANFGFGQPHDIYIFFQHEEGAISVDRNNKRLLSFSGHLLTGKRADANRAFADAEVVTDPKLLGKLAGQGTLIRLNNYYTVKDDKGYHLLPHGGIESQEYKLNILYQSKSGIAMAVDPDTSNGKGRP